MDPNQKPKVDRRIGGRGCYTQIKNLKNHMKKTETIDLKWIGGREVRLRQIGGVGLNLTMAVTLTMVGPATLRE